MKDKLVFDVTDVDTIADSDSVGAYVRASDGTLIDKVSSDLERLAVDAAMRDAAGNAITSTGGALDVNLASGVSLEVDLDHTEDSVALGNGTDLFTSTTIGSDIGLDVNVINDLDYLDDSVTAHQGGSWVIDSISSSVTVTATDLDIRDLAFATDSVDVSGSTILGITNDVNIADGGNSITVDSVDLDIRDLAFATDSVDVSGSTILGITNDVNIADGGNSITVDAVDLDIRDLDAAQDSVASHLFDGAGTALTSTLVGASQGLDVNILNDIQTSDSALADGAILSAADTLAVAGTAEKVVTSNLADRKYLFVRNNDNRVMYIGASGVTAANGFPVSPGSYLEMRVGASVDVYYNSAKAGHEIRTLELR